MGWVRPSAVHIPETALYRRCASALMLRQLSKLSNTSLLCRRPTHPSAVRSMMTLHLKLNNASRTIRQCRTCKYVSSPHGKAEVFSSWPRRSSFISLTPPSCSDSWCAGIPCRFSVSNQRASCDERCERSQSVFKWWPYCSDQSHGRRCELPPFTRGVPRCASQCQCGHRGEVHRYSRRCRDSCNLSAVKLGLYR